MFAQWQQFVERNNVKVTWTMSKQLGSKNVPEWHGL